MSLPLKIQNALKLLPIDGWLITDNPLGRKILNIPSEAHITRRFFYFCPREGSPIKIVHKIEQGSLHHLEGETRTYAGWRELESTLRSLFKPRQTVAVEVSKIPAISFTDGGTLQLLEGLGLQVVSSARLLQELFSVLSEEQKQTHHYAMKVLLKSVGEAMENAEGRTEGSVQKQILESMAAHGCVTNYPPIVAVGKNSANPHYSLQGEGDLIRKGEPLLIDLWCRQDQINSIYADITKSCVVGGHPSEEYQTVYGCVFQAQKKAIEFLQERIARQQTVYGYEVDEVARKEIAKRGYGEYFIHRLGHSIDTSLHGMGANFDSYETYDEREIIPNTCYSVEPGIYLPGKFGIRLETDVLISRAALHNSLLVVSISESE